MGLLLRWFGLRCLIKFCPHDLWRSDHNPDALWARCTDCGKLTWLNAAALKEHQPQGVRR